MKHYNRFSKLDFGFYKDYELALVYVFDAPYIEWCINNIEWFHITDINELMEIRVMTQSDNRYLHYIGKDAVFASNVNIWESYNEMVEDIGLDYSPCKYTFSDETIEINLNKTSSIKSLRVNDYKNDNSTYNGYNGWSDDAINEAFDGDPENTWNVD